MATPAKKPTKKAEKVQTSADIEKELKAKQADMLMALQSHKAGELTNPRVLKTHRRDIARLMTALNAKKKEETK